MGDLDRLLPCGRVDPKTENAVGHERFTAHCGCRTGLDGDKHLDERRHRTRVIHTIQLVKSCRIVDTNGLRHDFEEAGNETRASTVRLVQDRSQGGACCSFDRIENEVYEESGENLRGLEPDDSWHSVAAETLTDWVNWNVMAPLLLETARTYRKLETKKMSVTELELESLLLRKKRALTTTREVGAELALPRNLEEKTSIETRETFWKRSRRVPR